MFRIICFYIAENKCKAFFNMLNYIMNLKKLNTINIKLIITKCNQSRKRGKGNNEINAYNCKIYITKNN